MLAPEIKSKMEDMVFHMVELERGLRADPSADARHCRQVISGALAKIDMQMDSQWGERLTPRRLEVAIVEEEFKGVTDGSSVMTLSQNATLTAVAPASKSKAKKQNSPV